MNFLNPILLAGLAAIAVPIIIHLINRRRAVRRPFPMIEFLLRSQKRMAKRLKVKQLLLLLVRIGLFVLLPLAMARPYLLSESGSTAEERLPTAVVFVLDDSFSMGHSPSVDDEGAGSAFAAAKEEIFEELDALRPWDQVALVLAHAPPEAPVPDLVEDPGEVRTAVESLQQPSHLPTDIPAALAMARDIHATGELPSRRTVVLTDNTTQAWEATQVSPDELAALGEVTVVEVRSGDDMGNVALVGAGLEEPVGGAEGEYDVWCEIRNFGDLPRTDVRLDLEIDGELAGSTLVDLEADGLSNQRFRVEIARGGLHLARFSLQVSGPDAPADNQRFLTMQLDREVRALLVNGDPRNVPYRDELFYLERALQAGGSAESGIHLTIVSVEGLDMSFEDFDVVVLSNVAALPRGRVAELSDYVRNGGGLLFTAGSRIDPERYNQLFGELLPKPLRSIRELCSPDDPDANLLATRVARIETGHPVFRVFDLPGGESIQSASVYSYVLLEPTASGESRILVSYGDGGPALVDRDFGAGRVALLTTTIDRDWTDWPIRTAYLPMMRRLLRYLARRGTSTGAESAVVGTRFLLDVEAQNPERVIVTDPEGQRFVFVPETGLDSNIAVVPESPGHYEVSLSIAGTVRRFDELMFAANVPSEEADLAPVDPAIPESYVAAAAGHTGEAGEAGVVPDIPERRVSLWPPVLFIVLMLLYLESGLAVRRRMWTRIGERLRQWRRRTT